MATGTGKTITALSAFVNISHSQHKIALFIFCPLIHLVDQWYEECLKFNIKGIKCHSKHSNWRRKLKNQIDSLNYGSKKYVAILATYDSLRNNDFLKIVDSMQCKTMVIGDEVHGLGTHLLFERLPKSAEYKLGLSATPERYMDLHGTQRILDYFGDIVFKFSLKDAIEEGFLTPYMYFPVTVELTSEEFEEYIELTKSLPRYIQQDEFEAFNGNEAAKMILLKRARLLANAQQKLEALKRLILENKNEYYNIVYCGDKKVGNERFIDKVVKLLGKEIGLSVHTFTSEESSKERKRLVGQITEKKLHTLVAIRCLDEGIDIPVIRNAYILASTTNPRQYIQRRGRLLRKAPGKEVAKVYDFIAVPPHEDYIGADDMLFPLRRNLVRREIVRSKEFITTAYNGAAANAELLPLIEKYHLLDM